MNLKGMVVKFLNSYYAGLQDASEKRLWLWTFVGPSLSTFICVALGVLFIAKGRWLLGIVIIIPVLCMWAFMIRQRLRIIIPILAQRDPQKWGAH